MPRLDHNPVFGLDTVYSLSLGELAEEPQRDCPPANQAIRRAMLQHAFSHFGSAWMGGLQSWKEAGAILENGWPGGAERLRTLTGKLAAQFPQAKAVRRRLTWAENGDEVCRDRLQSGQIDRCWRTKSRFWTRTWRAAT